MGGSLSSKSPSIGEKGWKNMIYFDIHWSTFSITGGKLLTEMIKLVDPEEKIISVFIYKVPLDESQWTNLLLNHQFIVFKTNSYWWSIEKNDEGLTVQRSKKKDSVLRQFRLKSRITGSYWDVQLIEKAEGLINIGEFIHWLWISDHQDKRYNWLHSNCQIFAQLVFNEIAQYKESN